MSSQHIQPGGLTGWGGMIDTVLSPPSRWVVSQTEGNTTYHFLPSRTFPCCQSYVILLGPSLAFSQPCKQQFQRVETCLLVRISPVTSMGLMVVFFIYLWMFISEWLYCVSAFKYSGQIREDIKYQVSCYIWCRLLTSPHPTQNSRLLGGIFII